MFSIKSNILTQFPKKSQCSTSRSSQHDANDCWQWKVRLIYVHGIRYLFCKNSIYRSIERNKFVNGQIKTENQQKKTEWDHSESKLGWIQFNLFLNPWHGMTFLMLWQYIQSSIKGDLYFHPASHYYSWHSGIHQVSIETFGRFV